MDTAIKHRVPNRVKPSFVIFDIWALWHLGTLTLRAERKSAQMSKITSDRLTRTATHMVTVNASVQVL